MKYYIGIDTGLQGGISILNPDGTIQMAKMPLLNDKLDEVALRDILEPYKDKNHHVIMEHVGQIFKTSKAVAASMHYQTGITTGILIGGRFSFTKVSPKVWQKMMFDGSPMLKKKDGSNDTKATALTVARRIFPHQSFVMGGPRATKDHDGVVDALLLAEYGRRSNL